MSQPLVTLAGATGALGRQLVPLLRESGYRVRAIGRDPVTLPAVGADETRVADLTQSSQIKGVCESSDILISAAGARMSLRGGDPGGFIKVDYEGNRRLLDEALRSAVSKVVYVSLAGALALRHTEYARSHEMLASDLSAAGIAHTVVRPTGFFHLFGTLVDLASRGLLAIPGDGLARTNPIHEGDVALACVEAIGTKQTSLPVGGPETFTRLRIAELACEALGKPPKVRRAPEWTGGVVSRLLRVWNPRLAALIEFGAAVNTVDIVAPAFGQRRLGDYLRDRASIYRVRLK